MEIGQKLKTKRTASGLSQEALAEKIGVSRQTISSWENDRSYPDIGSILKLSDLYGVSLDELLKEDENMRKHVEESGMLTRRYWNLLFELAILLLPFGVLAAYWGLNLVGLTMQIVGLLMLPPLWLARYRLFGMSREDMRSSLIGWVLYVAAWLLNSFSGADVLGASLSLIASFMSLIGLFMVYSHGIYLERSTRFWLVIVLFFGIPIYVFFAGWLSTFEDMGAFSKVDPFEGTYRIEQVLYGDQTQASVELELRLSASNLSIDGQTIGEFQYQQPTENQTEQGIWLLTPENAPDEQYKLVVDEEGIITLSLLSDDLLQWRWQLTELPELWYHAETSQSTSSSELIWYPDWSGDPTELSWLSVYGPAETHLTCSDDSISTLTVIEEYHHGDQVETTEYTLERDEKNNFPLPEPIGEEGSGAYVVYRVDLADGVFLLRVDLK